MAAVDRLEQIDAARYLDDHPVEPTRRVEVVRALIEALKRSERKSETFLSKPLRNLAAKEDVPLLIESLRSDSLALRRTTLEALGRFPGDETATAVAAVLANVRSLRIAARESLTQMGPTAEPAVIALLLQSDRTVQVEACRVLQAIGTSASTVALAAAREDRYLARHAREALAAVQKRAEE